MNSTAARAIRVAPAKAQRLQVAGGQQMNAWSGQACNPYDTERVPRGSSGGSGVAVAANLVTVGICEQSGASCQGPASRNGIALLLTTKGITPDSGGIGNQWFIDRAGIHARTLADAARVLDAIKDPANGYYDPRDPFTALPRGLIPTQPYASFAVTDDALEQNAKPLQGMRIAILREHMVKRTPNHEAITDQIDQEIKTVLRDQLGAELVETITPDYPDDPDVPNLRYTFADALSELLPRLMPEIFSRRNSDGELVFAVPGYDVTSYDYLLKLSKRQAPLTTAINITNFATFGGTPCHSSSCSDVAFDIDRYLVDRGDARITNWAAWVANAKFDDDASRAGAENWANWQASRGRGKERSPRAQLHRRLALLRGDVRERHRRVRASGEHRADAEDSGPERRHGQSRRHHAVLPDSAHRRARRLHRRGLRAAVRAECGQDRLRLGACPRHAEVEAAASDADRDHVLRRARRGADADQGRHGLRSGDASPASAAGVWPVERGGIAGGSFCN